MAFGEELIIKLGLNSTAMERGLARAEGSVKRWARTIGAQFTGMFAGAAMIVGIKKTIDYADQLVDVADNIGTSTKFLQQFTRAAENNGSTSEQASTALQFLSRTIGEANSGVDEARKKFAKWGIDLDKTKGTVEGVTAALQKAARNMSQQDVAAMTLDFFGRSGKDLVSTLRMSAAEMESFKDGLPDDEDVRRMAALADEFKNVERSIQNAAIATVGELSIWWKSTTFRQKLGSMLPPWMQSAKTMDSGLIDEMMQEELRKKLLDRLREREAARARREAKEFVGPTMDELKASVPINEKLSRLKKLQADSAEREADARKRIGDAERELSTNRRDKASITLAELVNAPFRFRGRLGVEQQMAGRVNWLENAAEWNRSHGYNDLAMRQQEMARNIRSQMTNLPSMERYPEKDLQKSIEDANTSLIKVLKDDGIKIKELTEG